MTSFSFCRFDPLALSSSYQNKSRSSSNLLSYDYDYVDRNFIESTIKIDGISTNMSSARFFIYQFLHLSSISSSINETRELAI